MGKRLTPKWLKERGVKQVLIPGLIVAATLGWTGWEKWGASYYQNKQAFPKTGIVETVTDGDTFGLKNGVVIRLAGVNAPGRGKEKEDEATERLSDLVGSKRVWLEYDRYQDDKYGRVLAWVWVGCEESPRFLPADYMRLTYNQSREGLKDNPEGCNRGKLVQEIMADEELVSVERYKDRGELKYEERIME